MLGNLKEVHTEFKREHENTKIGLQNYDPKFCAMAVSSGTHTVCDCHENVMSMLSAVNIEVLTKNCEFKLKDYRDFINAVECPNATKS